MIRNFRLAAGLAGIVVTAAALAPTAVLARTTDEGLAAQARHNKAVVSAAFERWAAGGSDFFTEILAPNVIWIIEGSGPSAGRFEGRDAFMERAVAPFAGRLSTPVRPVETEVWADGDHVIIRWDGEGVARDGQPYENSYVWIFRLVGDQAMEVTAFLDLAPYDDVLRRIPAPGGE
jgi:uncharacterized protein